MYRRRMNSDRRSVLYTLQLGDLELGETAVHHNGYTGVTLTGEFDESGRAKCWIDAGLNSRYEWFHKTMEIQPVSAKHFNRIYRRWLKRGKPDYRFS